MRVVVTGATGFIGARLVAAIKTHGHEVKGLVRSPRAAEHVEAVGDLLDPDFDVDALVDGFDMVLHATSTTDGSNAAVWDGNVEPARRISAAASRSGARLVYISTTGVYGRSFGSFEDANQIPRRATSALSRARVAAEDHVFGAGGTVIRPHIVYGDGDRWVVPQLVRSMLALEAWIGSSDIAVAAISVERLAAATAALLHRNLPQALHAAETSPVTIRSLIEPEFQRLEKPLPQRFLRLGEAHDRLRHLGVSENALAMVGAPSNVNAAAFWGLAGASTP
jgi:nucleoside-diphosphate-sugar epimerase